MGRQQVREEFDHFVDQWADHLLRTAYLIIWDLGGAEDLVQECLLRVARRWPKVRAMEYPGAYARRVLVNLALDDTRRRSRHRAELDTTNRPVLEDHPDQRAMLALGAVELTADLLSALGTLPPRQRAVLVLRYFEDLSEQRAAEVLGCSVGTVKSTASRALERLRTATGSQHAGNGRSPRLFDLQPTTETKRSPS